MPVQPPPPLFRAPLAPHPTAKRTVPHAVLKRAAQQTRRLFDGPLLKKLSPSAYLIVFSAFLARREPAQPSSGRKRRAERSALAATTECAGTVFGCCLGSLVAYLKLAGVSTAFTVRQIEAALSPLAAAALKTHGVDSQWLCAGLASARVLRAQVALASTDDVNVALHSRNGNPLTMIGACASIFVTFSILASPMLGSVDSKQLQDDLEWLVDHNTLETTLRSASVLANAVPIDGWAAALPFELASLDAEQRALERAMSGVRVAREFAEKHRFQAASTLRKMLDWFARAAWPAGELLNERTHDAVLLKLSDARYFLSPPPVHASHSTPPELIPLAQLSGLADGTRRSESDASSIATGSSRTLSSKSSTASVLGDGDAGELGVEDLFGSVLVGT